MPATPGPRKRTQQEVPQVILHGVKEALFQLNEELVLGKCFENEMWTQYLKFAEISFGIKMHSRVHQNILGC